MSKEAVSKSRAEEGGKPPAAQTPVVSHEIVPGKFNDHEWNVLVDRDSSEDFVEEIVDDLIGVTLDKCFDLYIQKQVIPFTLSEAKDAILSIIEAEAEKKKKRKFKPYTGRMKSPSLKVTESLEQTVMTLLTQEIMASMPPPPQEKLTGLVTMPASCHSILKIETMEIAPGVMVKEGGRIKQGPARIHQLVKLVAVTLRL